MYGNLQSAQSCLNASGNLLAKHVITSMQCETDGYNVNVDICILHSATKSRIELKQYYTMAPPTTTRTTATKKQWERELWDGEDHNWRGCSGGRRTWERWTFNVSPAGQHFFATSSGDESRMKYLLSFLAFSKSLSQVFTRWSVAHPLCIYCKDTDYYISQVVRVALSNSRNTHCFAKFQNWRWLILLLCDTKKTLMNTVSFYHAFQENECVFYYGVYRVHELYILATLKRLLPFSFFFSLHHLLLRHLLALRNWRERELALRGSGTLTHWVLGTLDLLVAPNFIAWRNEN